MSKNRNRRRRCQHRFPRYQKQESSYHKPPNSPSLALIETLLVLPFDRSRSLRQFLLQVSPPPLIAPRTLSRVFLLIMGYFISRLISISDVCWSPAAPRTCSLLLQGKLGGKHRDCFYLSDGADLASLLLSTDTRRPCSLSLGKPESAPAVPARIRRLSTMVVMLAR
jgi:hypothetical protein